MPCSPPQSSGRNDRFDKHLYTHGTRKHFCSVRSFLQSPARFSAAPCMRRPPALAPPFLLDTLHSRCHWPPANVFRNANPPRRSPLLSAVLLARRRPPAPGAVGRQAVARNAPPLLRYRISLRSRHPGPCLPCCESTTPVRRLAVDTRPLPNLFFPRRESTPPFPAWPRMTSHGKIGSAAATLSGAKPRNAFLHFRKLCPSRLTKALPALYICRVFAAAWPPFPENKQDLGRQLPAATRRCAKTKLLPSALPVNRPSQRDSCKSGNRNFIETTALRTALSRPDGLRSRPRSLRTVKPAIRARVRLRNGPAERGPSAKRQRRNSLPPPSTVSGPNRSFGPGTACVHTGPAFSGAAASLVRSSHGIRSIEIPDRASG